MVHPATPIDFIRRINDLAKKENRERDADGDREVAYEFNEVAGDINAEDFNVSDDFKIRSPEMINYKINK